MCARNTLRVLLSRYSPYADETVFTARRIIASERHCVPTLRVLLPFNRRNCADETVLTARRIVASERHCVPTLRVLLLLNRRPHSMPVIQRRAVRRDVES